MDLLGLCAVCGKPANHTCPLCGKLVCERHFDGGACSLCSGGKKETDSAHPSSRAKLKFPLGGKDIKS